MARLQHSRNQAASSRTPKTVALDPSCSICLRSRADRPCSSILDVGLVRHRQVRINCRSRPPWPRTLPFVSTSAGIDVPYTHQKRVSRCAIRCLIMLISIASLLSSDPCLQRHEHRGKQRQSSCNRSHR